MLEPLSHNLSFTIKIEKGGGAKNNTKNQKMKLGTCNDK